jgi:hypothetical protein
VWVFLGSFFLFSNFYRVESHNKGSCCIGVSTMKHLQKSN